MSDKVLVYFGAIKDVLKNEVPLPLGYEVSFDSLKYIDQIAKLHHIIFGEETYEKSRTEMNEGLNGIHGKFWNDASPQLLYENELVGFIFSVYKAPWDVTPDCPYITDLIVYPKHRKMNIATWLIQEASRVFLQSGAKYISFMVKENNYTALNLYHKLGFKEWDKNICKREL